MKIFYTSDLHFHHEKCIGFDNRPFENLAMMHEVMIENWNRKVGLGDWVYILGDFSLGADVRNMNALLRKLNGRKYLIRGNHDYFIRKEGFDRTLLEGVYDYKRIIDEGKCVILSHYPIAVWDYAHRGSIHLYGHVHGQDKAFARHPQLINLTNAYNVGCMNWGYAPVSLEEILATQELVTIKEEISEDGVIQPKTIVEEMSVTVPTCEEGIMSLDTMSRVDSSGGNLAIMEEEQSSTQGAKPIQLEEVSCENIQQQENTTENKEELTDLIKEAELRGVEQGIKQVAIALTEILNDQTIANKTGLSLETIKALREGEGL